MKPKHVTIACFASAAMLTGALYLTCPRATPFMPVAEVPAPVTTVVSGPTDGEENGEPSSAGGIERWSVKTGVDPAATSIDLTPTPSTVDALRSLSRPPGLPARAKGDDPARYGPVETTVYSVHAVLTGYKLESDADYHLVIAGANGTMIAEIPWPPAIHGSSPWIEPITQARKDFDTRFGKVTSPGRLHKVNAPVTISGVGFFDYIHGQTGVALPTGIELHPVLSIKFGDAN